MQYGTRAYHIIYDEFIYGEEKEKDAHGLLSPSFFGLPDVPACGSFPAMNGDFCKLFFASRVCTSTFSYL